LFHFSNIFFIFIFKKNLSELICGEEIVWKKAESNSKANATRHYVCLNQTLVAGVGVNSLCQQGGYLLCQV